MATAGRPAGVVDISTVCGRMAAAIRGQRLKKKLSVEAAAKRAGCAVASWYDYEAGRRAPTIDRLRAIAEALGCHARALLPE